MSEPSATAAFQAFFDEVQGGIGEAVKELEDIEKRGRLRLASLYMLIVKPIIRQAFDEGVEYAKQTLPTTCPRCHGPLDARCLMGCGFDTLPAARAGFRRREAALRGA